MLVTFRSKAAAPITMFGEHASRLLDLMGASGRIPGAFSAADVPIALSKLQAALQVQAQHASTPAPPALNEDRAAEEHEDERQRDPPVSLLVRAAPLVSLLQRAVTAKAEVVWDKTG
jgi:hypothetical protein